MAFLYEKYVDYSDIDKLLIRQQLQIAGSSLSSSLLTVTMETAIIDVIILDVSIAAYSATHTHTSQTESQTHRHIVRSKVKVGNNHTVDY